MAGLTGCHFFVYEKRALRSLFFTRKTSSCFATIWKISLVISPPWIHSNRCCKAPCPALLPTQYRTSSHLLSGIFRALPVGRQETTAPRHRQYFNKDLWPLLHSPNERCNMCPACVLQETGQLAPQKIQWSLPSGPEDNVFLQAWFSKGVCSPCRTHAEHLSWRGFLYTHFRGP